MIRNTRDPRTHTNPYERTRTRQVHNDSRKSTFDLVATSANLVAGLALLPVKLTGETRRGRHRRSQLQRSVALMLARYCGPVCWAWCHGFDCWIMSGMAGNVSAFHDGLDLRYLQGADPQGRSRRALRQHGPLDHGHRVLISVGTAYLVMSFASIMDYVQALFSFFIAPLYGTVILACCGSGPPLRVVSGDCWRERFLPSECGPGSKWTPAPPLRGALPNARDMGGKHVPASGRGSSAWGSR